MNKYYKKPTFRRAGMIILLGLVLAAESAAQVNTEAMRRENLEPGYHIDLGGNVGYTDGNSSLFQNRSNLRLDYVQEEVQFFLVANYRLSRKDKTLFINKGFTHMRRIKPLRTALYAETFIQKEFNDFIQLNDRELIGVGVRIKWNELERFSAVHSKLTLNTGLGVMWEQESIDTGSDGSQGDPIHGSLASLIRSTNYIVVGWIPNELLAIQTTAYFQVDTHRIKDYRILTQTTMKIAISERLTVNFDINMRYDSEPPGSIEAFDIDFTNGFSYAI